MSATEQRQHPWDQEDPQDGESRSDRVEQLGDGERPGVTGHMSQTGATVGHRGSV